MRIRTKLLSSIVIATCLFSLASAAIHSNLQAGAAKNDPGVYARRRAALLQKIGDGLVVLQGAEEPRNYIQFRQNNDFYYLTGIDDAPNAILILDGRTKREILFLPAYNARTEKVYGHRLTPGKEASDRTGIGETMATDDFEKVIAELSANHKSVYVPQSPEEVIATSRDQAQVFAVHELSTPWDKRITREQAFANYFEGKRLEVHDLAPILDEMRRVKDQREIELLRRASQIGSQGHEEVLKAVHAGMYEYQVAALAEYIFAREGSQGPAYFPIVGSGPNSCALHYSLNGRQMVDGDIVVFDFAPDYGYYASDITRTFPVSGHFTPEQRKVYQVCLDAQKAGIAAVKPGATFATVTKAARDIIDAAGYGKYWAHGIGHYVGMAVHDDGEYNKPLGPGVVLTVEPGIYIPEKALGVRIEDVVLVTPNGHEVLSTVPKEIADIERLMATPKGGRK